MARPTVTPHTRGPAFTDRDQSALLTDGRVFDSRRAKIYSRPAQHDHRSILQSQEKRLQACNDDSLTELPPKGGKVGIIALQEIISFTGEVDVKAAPCRTPAAHSSAR